MKETRERGGVEELAGNAAAVPPLSLLLAGPVCTVFLSSFPGFSYGFRVVFRVGDFRGRSRGGEWWEKNYVRQFRMTLLVRHHTNW